MPAITISYDEASQTGRFTREAGVLDHVWIRVRSACFNEDAGARANSHVIDLGWSDALTVLRTLSPLQARLHFVFAVDGTAAELVAKFQAEVVAVSSAAGKTAVDYAPGAIETALAANGWKPERPLKPYQLTNLTTLAGLANGANFSVPGAGKTTVTFALHLLTSNRVDYLIVVGPRNAFPAWEGVVEECLVPGKGPQWEPFTPLVGGEQRIKTALDSGARRFIISYDQLVRVDGLIVEFISTHRTHLILDESHRMKAGSGSMRGTALLRMAHIPVRRDILTGTPMPQSSGDVQSQLDFLWPGVGLGSQIARGAAPRSVLGNLYVRTTKRDLQLPPRTLETVPVTLTDAHLALYAVIRDDFFARFSTLRQGRTAGEIIRARQSVMRLLRAAVDPASIANQMWNVELSDDAQRLLKKVIAEGHSQRLVSAVDLANELVANGKKVLLWTIFSSTMDQLQSLLKAHEPAMIHGRVALGDEADDETRQGQIRRFKADPRCMVMIANPAAASEGISLHSVCHDAIYVDRSYNAVHFLQSIDRIHRLGLPDEVATTIYILQNRLSNAVGSIDRSVSRRLEDKIRRMKDLLDDDDLHELALDEEEMVEEMDAAADERDILDLLTEIEGGDPAAGDSSAAA